MLASMARSYTLPYWQVVRAQMVLLAAQGLRNDQIAERCNCRREVVSQWGYNRMLWTAVRRKAAYLPGC